MCVTCRYQFQLYVTNTRYGVARKIGEGWPVKNGLYVAVLQRTKKKKANKKTKKKMQKKKL